MCYKYDINDWLYDIETIKKLHFVVKSYWLYKTNVMLTEDLNCLIL